MSAFETIRCDGCGTGYEWRVLMPTSWSACRKSLKASGWHIVRRTRLPIRDFCPTCWKAGLR